MALVTGSAFGTTTTQEDLFLEGAPTIYFQDARATPYYNPDADGFYWQLSGTATYPVFEIGCPTDVTFTENLTIYDYICDNVGLKVTIQQRNYFEFQFSVQSFFPLPVLTALLGGGTVVTNAGAHTRKMPLGKINNNQFWHLICPQGL